MKVLDRIMVRLRQLASINDSQFGFVPGRGTTDAIFVEKQLHEKYLANKRLYMSFVDLEKAFDGVPQKVIRWAPRKLGVEEWIVRLVQGMNANEQSHVRVGKGYSEELKWRSVFIKTRYSACCASSLCLKPCHASSALGSPERTSLPMTLVSSLNRLRNVTWGSWLGKRAMEEKRLSKCRKDIDHDLWYRPGPLQSSGEFPCAVCHTGVGSNIIFWNSCKHWVHKIAESSSAWQRTLITDVHSAKELHAAWTADHRESPRRTYEAGDGSFLLLSRRHALSSWWLWTFNHNTCENRLEEVQGAATSSLPTTSQDAWPRVQLLCAECNASCQWDLAIDKAKLPTSAAK